MQLRLIKNWKQTLTKAWSVRFIALAGILSAIEYVVSNNPNASSLVVTLVSLLAFGARFIAQEMKDEA